MNMINTRHGSCHCGAVRFSCEIDLAPEGDRSPQKRAGVWFSSTLRCNCSFCFKTRMWKNHVPLESFKLLAGSDNLSHYRFAAGGIDHTFCKTCGVYPFVSASEPEMGGEFVCVNVACLDDVSHVEFAAAPIRYEDGANDQWGNAPKVTGYL
jgi:hypothetical protein